MFLAIMQRTTRHAFIPENLVTKFDCSLIEGNLCAITNLLVTNNTGLFKPVPSTVMLFFLENTTIDILGDNVIQIPRYAFQFVNETTLRGRADDNTLLSGYSYSPTFTTHNIHILRFDSTIALKINNLQMLLVVILEVSRGKKAPSLMTKEF